MNQALIFDRSYINGAWTTEGTTSFDVRNPANGKIVATLMDGNIALTEKAIIAAAQAFKSWRNTTAKYRASLLEKWNDLILANTNHLAEIMTLECGKPLKESLGEVTYGDRYSALVWRRGQTHLWADYSITLSGHAA